MPEPIEILLAAVDAWRRPKGRVNTFGEDHVQWALKEVLLAAETARVQRAVDMRDVVEAIDRLREPARPGEVIDAEWREPDWDKVRAAAKTGMDRDKGFFEMFKEVCRQTGRRNPSIKDKCSTHGHLEGTKLYIPTGESMGLCAYACLNCGVVFCPEQPAESGRPPA